MRVVFSFGGRAARVLGLAVALAASALVAPAFARTGPCADVSADGHSYTICLFDPTKEELRLFWRGPGHEPLGSFEAAAATLGLDEELVFAMNAGMYDGKQAPIGLYIEKGVELKRANTRAGAGNFHLKPNGVFFVAGAEAGVMETLQFLSLRKRVDYATQSGPMLVVNGEIHPRISADGVSAKIRNGVGHGRDGRVFFVISNEPVTFHQFASLFKDALNCDNALYLDGSISALYAPNLGRDDLTRPMGPMVGAVERKR